MVGGGIFAVLGLSVQLARGGAPLAFGLAGIVAVLTAYSYARLSVTYPSEGGTVEFINRVFGRGLFSGSLNVLLWLSYVVMLALYAYALGGYAASLFGDADSAILRHLFMTVAIVVLTGLNAVEAAAVGRAETWIVAANIVILLLFVVVGSATIDLQRLAPGTWSSSVHLIAGGMLIFLAYEGFELIANTAQDVKDPGRTLPRAYFVAVIFVMALYVAVAAVTVGNLPVSQIVGARDYALAAAARPFLGQAGFTLIAVAAVLSTASALDATLYGAARISFIIAKEGELPEQLEHKVWSRPIEGLLITAGAALLAANCLPLARIATIGSAGFLLIFAIVNLANVRCAREMCRRRGVAWLGAMACLAALATLLWRTALDAPGNLEFFGGLLLLAVAVEWSYRRFCLARGRRSGALGG